MKSSVVKYSHKALLRTIDNRIAEALPESIWQTIPVLQQRAKEAAEALTQARLALQEPVLRDRALVILGRLLSPGSPKGATAAILGLRQDITSHSLDGVSFVRTLDQILELADLVSGTTEEDQQRWRWVAQTARQVAEANVDEVNLAALWRDSLNAIQSSIPIDTRWHKT